MKKALKSKIIRLLKEYREYAWDESRNDVYDLTGLCGKSLEIDEIVEQIKKEE